jgi:hypothetical protein
MGGGGGREGRGGGGVGVGRGGRTADTEKLKRHIPKEHRYGKRVVRMVEEFGLGIVAFRGPILHGDKYVCFVSFPSPFSLYQPFNRGPKIFLYFVLSTKTISAAFFFLFFFFAFLSPRKLDISLYGLLSHVVGFAESMGNAASRAAQPGVPAISADHQLRPHIRPTGW